MALLPELPYNGENHEIRILAGGPYEWNTASISYSLSIIGSNSEFTADGTFTVTSILKIENIRFILGSGTTNLIEVLSPGNLEVNE